MRGMEIWISSRLELSLAKSLSASDLNRIRIVIHSYQLAMTHDKCLWALGGSRFTTFVLAVTLIAVALFYFATPRSRINSVAVLPFVNGSSDGLLRRIYGLPGTSCASILRMLTCCAGLAFPPP
jgi:hypothetical protein